MTGRIYFIQSGEAGPVKIGWSANVVDRLNALQTGNPSPLTLLATFPADRLDESVVHDVCASLRIRGEWYRWCKQTLALIDAAKTSTNLQSFLFAAALLADADKWPMGAAT